MQTTTAKWLAWGLVGVTLALVAGTAVVIATAEGRVSFGASGFILVPGLIAFSVVGALVMNRAPGNIVGPLLLTVGVGGTISAVAAETWASVVPPLPGQAWAALVGTVVSIAWFAPLTLVLFRFPDGEPLSRAWLRIEWLALGAYALMAITLATRPTFDDYQGIENPIGIEGFDPALEAVAALLYLAMVAAAVSGSASFIARYRRSRGIERTRLKWLAFGAALIGFGFLLVASSFTVSDRPEEDPIVGLLFLPFLAGMLFFPVAVGIGILRYRLFDIDVVIRKTVVFGILVLLFMVVSIGLLLAASSPLTDVAPDETQAVGLTGLALGLLVWPLYRLARRIADRIVYRGRASPYEVLTEFSDRMSVTYSTDDVLPRLAAVLGEGTGAERATVWLRVGNQLRPEGIWPSGGEAPTKVPDGAVEVVHQGTPLGALSVKMPANDPMNPTKEKIVRDLAGQAGLVLRNVGLIEELRESRRRIVTAQDERAKKLERDIHDGAQQQLVALAVKERLAESFVGSDDERVRAMLAEIRADTNDALQNLRDLARGIYPPLLADQGLGAALGAQTRKSGLAVSFDADGVGRYPQEVEGAVYFSVLEAMQNVAKYARAERVIVRLTDGGGDLRFEVEDDGVGFDPLGVGTGTGLQGMADRLAAIGGLLSVTSDPGSGTTVAGSIPTRELRS